MTPKVKACAKCGGSGRIDLPPTYPPRRGEFTYVDCPECNTKAEAAAKEWQETFERQYTPCLGSQADIEINHSNARFWFGNGYQAAWQAQQRRLDDAVRVIQQMAEALEEIGRDRGYMPNPALLQNIARDALTLARETGK